MKIYELKLIYKDSSTFLVGAFNSLEKVNAWIAEESTRSYWDSETETEITEKNNGN